MPEVLSRKTRYKLQYAVIWAFLRCGRILPFPMRVKLGGALLGFAIAHLKTPRGRIESNLQRIFPEMSADERKKIINAVAKNFGKSFIEVLNNHSSTKYPELRHVSGPGLLALREAQASGRGAILVSGHFGQWDAARLFLKAEGTEVGAVYRPSNNTYFDRLFVPQIENAGRPAFSSGRRGTLEMVRHIRAGGVVAILLDQRFHDGEKLDFMGQPAMTSTAAASMALKYDLPMIPVYCTRRGNSLHIDVEFEEPIPHSTPTEMTQLANDSLTRRVQETPGQWYWLHNRWST